MDLLGFEVEAQTPTADDRALAVGRWFDEVFGVVPRLSAYVADLDAAVGELAAKGMATTPIDPDDTTARAVRVAGPAGLTVDVVQTAPAGHYEAQIADFIESASDLDGPPTEDVADAVHAIVAVAWDAIDACLDGVAHNKVLATQLLLSQRSRSDAPDSPTYWQRSAASTLLSGFVGRGVAS